MTLTTSHNWIAYTAAGGTVFAYDFLIVEAADLRVYDNRVLVTSGYTVSGVGVGSGGNVTFSAAPTNGHVLLFIRATDSTQQVNLVEGDRLPSDSVEGVFDKVYVALQDTRETATRAFGLPVSRAGQAPVMPNLEDSGVWGKAVKVNAAGTGLDVFSILSTDIASPITSLGDLIQGGVAGVPERLAIGSAGQVATVAAGKVSWATPPADTLPVTILDAKGDLIAGTAADTAARLAVGANDTVLQADSTQSTGLGWRTSLTLLGIATPATPAAGKGVLYAPSGTPLQRPAWLDAGGQVTILPGVINKQSGAPLATTGVSNTTEATLATFTLKGNSLGTDRMLRIKAAGDALNNSGGAIAFPTIKVYFGASAGLTLTGNGSNLVNSATRSGWQLRAEIVGVGATNAQFADGTLRVALSANVSGGNVSPGGTQGHGMSTNNGLAVDSTADQTVKITMTNGTSNANVDTRGFYMTVELL